MGERLTASAVRKAWASMLNTAGDGRSVVFHRGNRDFALIPADLLRDILGRAVPAPEVVAEDDGWTVVLAGHPIAADGQTLDEALGDFVHALRDYAVAFDDRLHLAPNHQHAAVLVQHVSMRQPQFLREPTGSQARPQVYALPGRLRQRDQQPAQLLR